MRELIAEHKLNGKKEITFARTISTDNNIVTLIERLDNCLLAIALETLNNDLRKRENNLFFGVLLHLHCRFYK